MQTWQKDGGLQVKGQKKSKRRRPCGAGLSHKSCFAEAREGGQVDSQQAQHWSATVCTRGGGSAKKKAGFAQRDTHQ